MECGGRGAQVRIEEMRDKASRSGECGRSDRTALIRARVWYALMVYLASAFVCESERLLP